MATEVSSALTIAFSMEFDMALGMLMYMILVRPIAPLNTAQVGSDYIMGWTTTWPTLPKETVDKPSTLPYRAAIQWQTTQLICLWQSDLKRKVLNLKENKQKNNYLVWNKTTWWADQ